MTPADYRQAMDPETIEGNDGNAYLQENNSTQERLHSEHFVQFVLSFLSFVVVFVQSFVALCCFDASQLLLPQSITQELSQHGLCIQMVSLREPERKTHLTDRVVKVSAQAGATSVVDVERHDFCKHSQSRTNKAQVM